MIKTQMFVPQMFQCFDLPQLGFFWVGMLGNLPQHDSNTNLEMGEKPSFHNFECCDTPQKLKREDHIEFQK